MVVVDEYTIISITCRAMLQWFFYYGFSCVTRSARLASQGSHGVSGGVDPLTLPPSISTSLRSSCLSLNLTGETNSNGNVSSSKRRPEVESEVTCSRDRDMLMAHSKTLTSPPLTLTQVSTARDSQPASSSSRASSIHSHSAHAPPLRIQQGIFWPCSWCNSPV